MNSVQHFLGTCCNGISRAVSFVLIYALLGLRPLLGAAQCRFEQSCTKYAVEQLREKSIVVAAWLILLRLLSCNPFYRGL